MKVTNILGIVMLCLSLHAEPADLDSLYAKSLKGGMYLFCMFVHELFQLISTFPLTGPPPCAILILDNWRRVQLYTEQINQQQSQSFRILIKCRGFQNGSKFL